MVCPYAQAGQTRPALVRVADSRATHAFSARDTRPVRTYQMGQMEKCAEPNEVFQVPRTAAVALRLRRRAGGAHIQVVRPK